MLGMMLFAAATASSGHATNNAVKPVCQDRTVELVEARSSSRLQKLNELPNADMVLGVVRTENGCSKPAIVRYDIGSAPQRR